MFTTRNIKQNIDKDWIPRLGVRVMSGACDCSTPVGGGGGGGGRGGGAGAASNNQYSSLGLSNGAAGTLAAGGAGGTNATGACAGGAGGGIGAAGGTAARAGTYQNSITLYSRQQGQPYQMAPGGGGGAAVAGNAFVTWLAVGTRSGTVA